MNIYLFCLFLDLKFKFAFTSVTNEMRSRNNILQCYTLEFAGESGSAV
jgi:hypothetical protein